VKGGRSFLAIGGSKTRVSAAGERGRRGVTRWRSCSEKRGRQSQGLEEPAVTWNGSRKGSRVIRVRFKLACLQPPTITYGSSRAGRGESGALRLLNKRREATR